MRHPLSCSHVHMYKKVISRWIKNVASASMLVVFWGKMLYRSFISSQNDFLKVVMQYSPKKFTRAIRLAISESGINVLFVLQFNR